MAGLYDRVPETVVLLLLAGSALSLGMVGYSAGLRRRRSVLSALVLVVALGVVLTIVIDLDRPAEGFIRASPGAPRRPEGDRHAVAVTLGSGAGPLTASRWRPANGPKQVPAWTRTQVSPSAVTNAALPEGGGAAAL